MPWDLREAKMNQRCFENCSKYLQDKFEKRREIYRFIITDLGLLALFDVDFFAGFVLVQ